MDSIGMGPGTSVDTQTHIQFSILGYIYKCLVNSIVSIIQTLYHYINTYCFENRGDVG